MFAEHTSSTDEAPTADGEAYLTTTTRKVENKTNFKNQTKNKQTKKKQNMQKNKNQEVVQHNTTTTCKCGSSEEVLVGFA